MNENEKVFFKGKQTWTKFYPIYNEIALDHSPTLEKNSNPSLLKREN